MSPSSEVAPQLRLAELLRGLFSAADLRRFVRLGPEGAQISALLPEHAGLDELATEAVAVLERRGEIDAALFARLVRERPRRAAAIEAVRRAWLGADESVLRPVRPPRRALLACAVCVAVAAVSIVLASSWSEPRAFAPAIATAPVAEVTRPSVPPPVIDEMAVKSTEPPATMGANRSPERTVRRQPRALSRDALLELLRSRQAELQACERAFAGRFGSIPPGKYAIDFSTDEHGLLRVGRPRSDMMSSWACFRDVFASASREAGAGWRPRSSSVVVDLEEMLAAFAR